MNPILIYPTYFPSISHFIAMAQAETITFEMEDNFQKQTNRNRMYIYSPNGIQMLNVPVKHTKEIHQKQKISELNRLLDGKTAFQIVRSSIQMFAFFEYFEDDFTPIFEKKFDFLMDLNLEAIAIVSKCLGMPLNYQVTTEYFNEVTAGVMDFRSLANGKKTQQL